MENVLDILKRASIADKKLRFWYGDKKTGRPWLERYDTFGYVRKTCGSGDYILLKRKDSHWGTPILSECIIKITIDHEKIYEIPNYNMPKMEVKEASENIKRFGYDWSVFADGVNIYNCKTKLGAEREVEFHEGRRNG